MGFEPTSRLVVGVKTHDKGQDLCHNHKRKHYAELRASCKTFNESELKRQNDLGWYMPQALQFNTFTVMPTLPLLAGELCFFSSSPALPLWYINVPLFTCTLNIEYLVKSETDFVCVFFVSHLH